MLKQNFQKQIGHVLFSSGEYHLVICLQMPYPCMSSSFLFNLQFLIALCAILRFAQAVSHIECYLWIMCLLLSFSSNLPSHQPQDHEVTHLASDEVAASPT